MRAGTAVSLILGLMMLFVGAACTAQLESSASAFASSEEPIRSVVGTFVFEQGSSVGLEIERREPCPCLCDPLLVTGMHVLDEQDNPIFVTEQQDPVGLPAPYGEWIGRWNLVDQLGGSVSSARASKLLPQGEQTGWDVFPRRLLYAELACLSIDWWTRRSMIKPLLCERAKN